MDFSFKKKDDEPKDAPSAPPVPGSEGGQNIKINVADASDSDEQPKTAQVKIDESGSVSSPSEHVEPQSPPEPAAEPPAEEPDPPAGGDSESAAPAAPAHVPDQPKPAGPKHARPKGAVIAAIIIGVVLIGVAAMAYVKSSVKEADKATPKTTTAAPVKATATDADNASREIDTELSQLEAGTQAFASTDLADATLGL
jgi:hypothetical protein